MAATDIARADRRLTAEYEALTGACGLVDRSERGKLALSGPDAKAFLAGQVTNDVEALGPGTGCYAAFLTHKGKMLGDLRILDLAGAGDDAAGEDGDLGEQLLLDTERSTLQALFDMIRRFQIGYRIELHKRTLERGLLSLIGPDADRLAGIDDSSTAGEQTDDHDTTGPARKVSLGQDEHSNAAVSIDDIAALAVRTDVGIDLLCRAEDTDALARGLRERGARPVCEEAAEIVRVERGRPRYGVDLDGTAIPQEAGLNERAVSFTKGCYVGQETVARLYYKGKPNRHLRGLRLSEPAAPGAELRLGERAVGTLTSAVVSPRYGPIGLALLRREAEPGESLIVGEGPTSADVVELPFGTDRAIRPDERGARI